jgi:CubicO group peptidase (beta-lactamase class C family)
MPAGGLFSTANDCARFCQMILHRGTFEGRRYLSEAAVAEMTTKQTAPNVESAYGYCWQMVTDGCGHSGALSTNMTIDWKRELVFVYLVQHAGFPADGNKASHTFYPLAGELK